MNDPITLLNDRFANALATAFGEDYRTTDPILRPAQNPKFGDYQANVAMGLSKKLSQNPRDIATKIIENIDLAGICETPEIAGPGFINLKLANTYLTQILAALAGDPRLGVSTKPNPQTVVVDYSSPNVAKEMHVGHIRSTVIGDAIVRTLEFLGDTVIRQNHIGDWGTQFGMLIEYMLTHDNPDNAHLLDASRLNTLYKASKAEFDSNPDFAEQARQRVVKLQGGETQTLDVWKTLVNSSSAYFQSIYERLGVKLTADDACGESFYNDQLADTVADLEEKDIISESNGAKCAFPKGFTGKDDEPMPLIIQKSDGGFLYATTDLAAVRYRVTDLKAHRVVYVTDSRQKQHFAMFFQTATEAGWLDNGTTLEHVPFGTILGEDKTPFKTRSGDTIRLVDLLDEAEQRATDILTEKQADFDPDQLRQIAKVVGIGAIKYADLASDRVKDYIFSWDRMMATDGNAAPYLQYAHARIQSIFNKANASFDQLDLSPDALPINDPAERALVLKLVQFPEVLHSVADRLEPHHLCAWLYDLATAFNRFFTNCPVLRADNDTQKNARLVLCHATAAGLKLGLSLLGIHAPERM